MIITKLEVNSRAEIGECISVAVEWLRANDEQPIWLLRQVFNAVFSKFDKTRALLVWQGAMKAYYETA